MSASPLSLRGALLAFLTLPLAAQEPVLNTPGTATWSSEGVNDGVKTTFTLTDNTVLNWNRLNVKSSDELVFDFIGGEKVLNLLSGGTTHRIDGTVTSNGIVGFFSPNARLQINGTINAKGVTLSTLNVDPVDFFDGGSLTMSASGNSRRLGIDGRVSATQGDVIVAGSEISVGETAVVEATAGSILYAADENVTISESGTRRISAPSGDAGVIGHLGNSNAGRVEVSAGSLIRNEGRLGNGNGKVFAEVGSTGRILINGRGEFSGIAVISKPVERGADLQENEGDNLQAIGDAIIPIPALKRPDGSKVTSATKVKQSSPMVASSDAGRVAKRSTENRQVARADAPQPILRRSSFFGVRGGTKVASR